MATTLFCCDKQKINPNSTGVLNRMGGSHFQKFGTKGGDNRLTTEYERYGRCTDCGWCCDRIEYYYYPESYSSKKARILAYNESKCDKRFVQKVSSWIEEVDERDVGYNGSNHLFARVVKIEIGCKFLEWKYKWGQRESYCKVYDDPTQGCNFDRRKSYPENPEETPPNGECGYKFKIKRCS